MLCARAETSTLRPGGEWEMALNRPQHFLGLMSQLGHSRRGQAASKPGHVAYAPIATNFFSAAKRRNVPFPTRATERPSCSTGLSDQRDASIRLGRDGSRERSRVSDLLIDLAVF